MGTQQPNQGNTPNPDTMSKQQQPREEDTDRNMKPGEEKDKKRTGESQDRDAVKSPDAKGDQNSRGYQAPSNK